MTARDPLQALVDAERACAEPPEGAEGRNWRALEARMAAGAVAPIAWKPPTAALAGSAATAKAGLTIKVVLVSAVLGAGAVGVVAGVTRERPARVGAPALAAAAETRLPAPTAAADEAPPSSDEEAPAAAAPRTPQRAAAAASASAGLADELRVLKQAQREMKEGSAEKALELLERHDKRSPDGQLAEERAAARVLALCKARRATEARAAAAEFVRRFPGSPHHDRVTSACATGKEK